MSYTYTDTAPELPPIGRKVTWSHSRTDAQGVRIMHLKGTVLHNDPVSGLSTIRKESGTRDRVATRRLKLC